MPDEPLSPLLAQPTKRARRDACPGASSSGSSAAGASAPQTHPNEQAQAPQQAQVQPQQRDESSTMGALLEELECSICSKLLYEPVTIACGHTFCRACLVRALDAKDTCPLCRSVVHVDATQPVAVTHALASALRRAFPAEYAARAAETHTPDYGVGTGRLPLFPLNHVVFPGHSFPLHIFEPRYRLMLRRVLAGQRCFGLILNGADVDVGCVLHITRSVPMPDGRSLIETKAGVRFRVLRRNEVDGYLVGTVRPVEDAPPPSEAAELAVRVRAALDELLRAPALAHEQVRGKMADAPGVDADPATLGLWLAGLLVTDTADRQRMLQGTDSMHRLREVHALLARYQARVARESSGAGNPEGCHRECVLM